VFLGGTSIGSGIVLTKGAQTTNVACAVGVAHRLGVPNAGLVASLGDLPIVPHRLAVATAPSGVVVIDDTYNSNPAGARAALGVLHDAAASGRRVVVTPGMVELGRRQPEENETFAGEAAEVATDLLVVGRTNRSALTGQVGQRNLVTVRTREDAVQWVRANLVAGDAVLYENDLPDHYP
jgi:UDP-N-acetylmuramoyl-tripeptide--D-alanyl-D-alanine ligase